MTERIDVGLIGATGTVGRQLARQLRNHPWFRLAQVAASSASAGLAFGAAVVDDIDDAESAFGSELLDLPLREPADIWEPKLLLSALPSAVAGPLEIELAERGHLVVSNASSHRMDPDVPLIIPELNPDHLELVDRQRWRGGLVTNPNCSVVGLAVALAPLHLAFGLDAVSVSTLQALSGAGRPGPSAGAMVDNVLPHIAGEEEKLACEPQKILGTLAGSTVTPAAFRVSAHTHRVPVSHGHLQAVSVRLRQRAEPDAVAAVLAGFKGALGDTRLPSAPAKVIELLADDNRPQPRLDRDRGDGMTVSIGRVRRCEVFDVKFTLLVHNLVRGAAGAALLNAELCRSRELTEQVGAR